MVSSVIVANVTRRITQLHRSVGSRFSSRVTSSGLPSSRVLSHPNQFWQQTTTPSQSCMFSSDSDSHSDFAPQKKTVDGEEEAIKMIGEHVKNNRVMLYMKGNPSMPMCGFSARVVKILKDEGIDFSSVNVLDYPSIREGVKKFSQWPTIPQLYINGEFIGGCDIVTSMHESGELSEVLKESEDQ